MSDELALLAAILAHPDEDTPRLMYADWLDEHGQPERAEFIRIQCAPDADEVAEDRAYELEERNRAKWLAGLPQFPGARWEFRRGFPEYLDVPAELFLERYDSFARVPWLRFLSLHDLFSSQVRDLANREWGPRWVELELQAHRLVGIGGASHDGTVAVAAIANCPQVKQLRQLQLSLFAMTPNALFALATSPHLDGLKTLQIDGNRDDPRFHPLRERFGDRLQIG
jgi:uncharacterized protein (TIGR02996 family)